MSDTITNHLYEVLQSKRSSSSGTGTSHYSLSATCGMKGRLYEQFPWEDVELDGTDVTATGRRKVDGKRCGTFYHALQELWRTGKIDDKVIVSAEHLDYDFETAVRCFVGYRNHYLGNRNNLGRVISAEVKYPHTPEQEELIKAAIGGLPFTIRYDLLTEITMDDCNRLAVHHGVALPGPGRYLVDYKLVYALSAVTMMQYTYDFQQLAYPVIYNLCNPDTPVRGMITDVMARVQKPEPRHFALYLAHADENAHEIVRHGVLASFANHTDGRANPMGCIGKYGPCRFLTSGQCPRYGTYDDFVFHSDGSCAKK